jgi:hypothetical protein
LDGGDGEAGKEANDGDNDEQLHQGKGGGSGGLHVLRLIKGG